MKHFIPMMAIVALFFVSCSDRNGVQDSNSLKGATFILVERSETRIVNHYLKFDYPWPTFMKEYEEYTYLTDDHSGFESFPIEWKYTIDGSLITLVRNDPEWPTNVKYATYHKDSIYYGIRIYHRVSQ